MRAIILAAGRGSRMKELTEDRPKCLVELAGHTLFSLQLKALQEAGISEIAVVGGYRAGQLKREGLTLFVNERWAETNMVGSLAKAADWLQNSDCIVSYADIFYPAETVRRLISADGRRLTIAYDPDWRALWQARFANPLSDAESFQLTDGNRLAAIGSRVSSYDQIQGQYMGLLRFTPEAWSSVQQLLENLTATERDRLDMTSLLSLLLGQGEDIRTVQTAPGWGEVDSESDLDYYTAEVVSGRLILP